LSLSAALRAAGAVFALLLSEQMDGSVEQHLEQGSSWRSGLPQVADCSSVKPQFIGPVSTTVPICYFVWLHTAIYIKLEFAFD